jgi:hypothetical protein
MTSQPSPPRNKEDQVMDLDDDTVRQPQFDRARSLKIPGECVREYR